MNKGCQEGGQGPVTCWYRFIWEGALVLFEVSAVTCPLLRSHLWKIQGGKQTRRGATLSTAENPEAPPPDS